MRGQWMQPSLCAELKGFETPQLDLTSYDMLSWETLEPETPGLHSSWMAATSQWRRQIHDTEMTCEVHRSAVGFVKFQRPVFRFPLLSLLESFRIENVETGESLWHSFNRQHATVGADPVARPVAPRPKAVGVVFEPKCAKMCSECQASSSMSSRFSQPWQQLTENNGCQSRLFGLKMSKVTKASYASWSSSCFSKEYARGWTRQFIDTINVNPPPGGL